MPDHPYSSLLQAVPQIVASSDDRYEEVKNKGISLKDLFQRENMDRFHVDCLILYRIALHVLEIMKGIRQAGICPGLYDLKDFYVDPGGSCQVFLLHPERFQQPDREQDYEWYPEDERVFGERIFFDEGAQNLADLRLLYKILVASVKGNVKVPPLETRADYSSLFYKTLPPELKELFWHETEEVPHQRVEALLKEAISLERESAGRVKERYAEMALAHAGDLSYAGDGGFCAGPDLGEETPLYCLFVLLRTETGHSGRIGKLLYQEQDRLEIETDLTGRPLMQAFVYGDGFIEARDFSSYPRGFRIQLPQVIREYSCAEGLIIACEYASRLLDRPGHPGPAPLRIIVITDGRLKNDGVFHIALDRLAILKKRGCSLRFLHTDGALCEACDQLQKLCK